MLLAIALLHAPAGFGQIYGFMDSEGVSHFAAEPLDDRYTQGHSMLQVAYERHL